MNIGHVFVIAAGLILQTLAASVLSGAPSAWFLFLIVLAVLWALIVNMARGKNRDIGPWLGAAFLVGPLITAVVLLFVPARNIHEPQAPQVAGE